MSRPGTVPWASTVGGEHSSKELFAQRIKRYSEHLYMSLRQYKQIIQELGTRTNVKKSVYMPKFIQWILIRIANGDPDSDPKEPNQCGLMRIWKTPYQDLNL